MSQPAVDSTTEESVFRLVYRSHDLIAGEERRAELGGLFTVARRNNKQRGITGALLLCEETFVQTLEGDEAEVRALFNHIRADPRHDQVTVLETGVVGTRVFAHWAMAEVAMDDDDADTTLIAHKDGIAPAAGRRTTSEQDGVLDRMRTAARGSVPVR